MKKRKRKEPVPAPHFHHQGSKHSTARSDLPQARKGSTPATPTQSLKVSA